VVAGAALDEGAAIINDISGLCHDPAMISLAAETGCAVILMHMRGGPTDHARHVRYRNVVAEVRDFLDRQARKAVVAGVRRSRIIVDPGLGFAKNAIHNLELVGGLSEICALGYPVLIGASRKRFIRAIAGAGESDLLMGNAALNALAIAAGASIIRVHEPGPMVAAMRMAVAVAKSSHG
jgi:dihydropteroate synthase